MLALLAAATAALFPVAPPPNADRLVQLTPAAVCTDAVTIAEAGGVPTTPALRIYRLDAAAAAVVLPGLRARGALQHVSVNRPTGTLSVSRTTSDPLSAQEWWRAAVGIDGLTPPGPGKPVTVVDSGINVNHPEFLNRPNTRTLNAQEPAPLGGEHGTMVSSLIGAPENGVGVVGIYPQVDLRSWDAAIGAGTQLDTQGIVDGIIAASRIGPSVVNLSLGGSRDTLIEQAVNIAISRGVLVVAASGNEGPSSPLGYPAALPHVLTVAATSQNGNVAEFSSWSPYVDLAAPGDDVLVASAIQNSWVTSSGTSFSSPLVAGAAAWVWTLRPELDASQLFEVMRRSAVDIAPTGRDDRTGRGMLNVAAALAAPAPPRDPLEPNDDVDVVSPDDIYFANIKALTTRAKPNTSVAARMDRVEDPRDLYRVWIPAGRRLVVTARSTVDVDLTVAAPGWVSILDVSEKPLARSRRRGAGTETTTVPATKRGRTAYVAVLFGRGAPREASYTLTLRAR